MNQVESSGRGDQACSYFQSSLLYFILKHTHTHTQKKKKKTTTNSALNVIILTKFTMKHAEG